MAASGGIKSIEQAEPILQALVRAPGPLPLKRLAEAAGMPRGQAHKYLTSLVRCGLVSQAGPGEAYGLGPLAIAFGFAAMRGLDIVTAAGEALDILNDRLEASSALTVWGNYGPTVVRWSVKPDMMAPTMALGAVFPVTTSLVGLVFAAYLDPSKTDRLIEAELNAPNATARRTDPRSRGDLEIRLRQVRRDLCIGGPSQTDGVVALAAPVFDHSNTIAAAIAVAGLAGKIDVSPEGETARTLLEVVEQLSQRLGGTLRRS